jgi:peptidoglycan/LPS O-acetylase OafA/YrhL
VSAACDRIEGLDGLRGLAAVCVAFVYHAPFMYGSGAIAESWFSTWLHRHGWTLVDLFFVLSGYIFAHVYIGAKPLETSSDLKTFMVARFARLYPLHLFLLIVAAILFHDRPRNDLDDFVIHLLMLQSLLPAGGHSYIGPAWSVSVEVFCYLLFALGGFAGRHHLRSFALVACVAGLVLMTIQPPQLAPSPIDAVGRGLFGFFIGQLLWHGRGHAAQLHFAWPIIGVLAGLWLANGVLPPVIAMTLITAPCLLIIAMRFQVFGGPIMSWLGDRSYTIYLVHIIPIMLILQLNAGPLALDWGGIISGHAALILSTLVISDVLYRRFELPMRRAIMAAWTRRHRREA